MKIGEKTVDLPGISGSTPPGTMTDYAKPGTEIVMFYVDAKSDTGYVAVSKEGMTIEQGVDRILSTNKLVKEQTILKGETYERPIKTKYGIATLILKNV